MTLRLRHTCVFALAAGFALSACSHAEQSPSNQATSSEAEAMSSIGTSDSALTSQSCTSSVSRTCAARSCGCYYNVCSGGACAELLPGPLPGPAFDVASEYSALLADVTGEIRVHPDAVPDRIGLFDTSAFPVVAKDDAIVVAAAQTSVGRAVAFAHDAFFGGEGVSHPASRALLGNAARWAAHGNPAPRVGVSSFDNQALAAALTDAGADAAPLERPIGEGALSSLDVLAIAANQDLGPDELAAIDAFSARGGGLLVAGLAWSTGRPPGEFAGNRLLARAGMGFTGGYAPRAPFPLQPSLPITLGAAGAYNELASLERPTSAPGLVTRRLRATLSAAFAVVPAGSALSNALVQLARETRRIVPSDTSAGRFNTDQRPFEAIGLEHWARNPLPARQVTAHPAATDYPGQVAAGGRLAKSTTVDTRVPLRHSTGLYAAPGQVITVETPSTVSGVGLSVLIGAHTDSLWNSGPEDPNEWLRAPSIARSFPLDAPSIEAANEFGGLVYVVVPFDLDLGPVAVTIRDAVEAPLFVAGTTTAQAWRTQLRNTRAPWGEIQAGNLILTVRTSTLRAVASDPAGVARFWDAVLEAEDALAPRQAYLSRSPMRTVFDRQISGWGELHSGYPVMGKLAYEQRTVLTNAQLMANPDVNWGMYHELGHNHQNDDWTPPATGEVTCNLFSMYAPLQVTGVAKETLWEGNLTPATQQREACNFFYPAPPDEPSFARWKASGAAAQLHFYVRLIDAFGWDALEQVLATYQTNPIVYTPDEQVAGEEGERRREIRRWDEWYQRYSQAVALDLLPYFAAWRFPISEPARAQIAALALPSWSWPIPTRASCGR